MKSLWYHNNGCPGMFKDIFSHFLCHVRLIYNIVRLPRLGVPEVYNTKKTGGGADRFIPNRSTADLELASHSIANNTEDETNSLSSTQIERRRYILIEDVILLTTQ